jgi:hypothetical protein
MDGRVGPGHDGDMWSGLLELVIAGLDPAIQGKIQ